MGAVVFSGRDHSLADHRSIVVALPLRGTHDNRGYVAAQITAEQMTAETDKHTTAIKLAEVAAAIAVHGYLQASIVTQSLQVSEATTHMLNRLWQVR
ncbi:hypothetical protein H7097_01205 [Aeromicrobium sp.]|nr:hypothetical protein [Candidatus Saccharibacteria bacterium]